MIVKLKKRNARYRDLTFGQPYVVIGIEADELRILNDAGVLSYIALRCSHWSTNGNPLIGLLNSATTETDIHIPPRLTSPVSLKTSSTKRQRPSQRSGAW